MYSKTELTNSDFQIIENQLEQVIKKEEEKQHSSPFIYPSYPIVGNTITATNPIFTTTDSSNCL